MPLLVRVSGVELAFAVAAGAVAITGTVFALIPEEEDGPLVRPRVERPFRSILRTPGMLRLFVVAALYIIVLQAILSYTVPSARDAGLSTFWASFTYFAVPAVVAVSLFHFFFAWNDFFVPLLYLSSKPDLQPLSIGIQQFNALFVVPAHAHPGGRAHDHGRAGRRVLPRPAGVHARRRGHRGREMTVEPKDAAADDAGGAASGWPAVPQVAWTRPLGLPAPDAGRPRVHLPMIDDGPWGGVPIGGLGSGSIGLTPRGDFARWHLRVGRHRFLPVAADGFAMFVGTPEGTWASPLAVGSAPTLPSFGPALPVGSGTYAALFPRAWSDVRRAPVPGPCRLRAALADRARRRGDERTADRPVPLDAGEHRRRAGDGRPHVHVP